MTPRLRGSMASMLVVVAVAACAPVPPAPVVGLLDVAARPAEKALLAGLRAYDDAQYAESETQLSTALRIGLASPRDRAAAHKHLAFIYCSSARIAPCEAAFQAARGADPAFELTRAEAGHPLWGPIYRKLAR